MGPPAATVDEYIAGYPAEVQVRLRWLRSVVREIAPSASEGISYGMPAYKDGGVLIYFGAFKDHVGIYGAGGAAEAFATELKGRVTTKGSIQFRHDEPFPEDLLRRVVEHRVNESRAVIAARKAAKPGKSRA